MNVCLINPPDTMDEDPLWDEPLGLLYLGKVLELKGIKVEVLDMNFYDDLNILKNHKADVYGIYCSTSLIKSALEVNQYLKKQYPSSLRIVGGPHPTCLPHEMTEYFDKVVVGEGENAIIKALEKDSEKIISCPPIEDLDKIHFPARHLIPIHKYHRTISGLKSTSLITSRGCPNRCAFCCKKARGKNVRFRSAENVLSEVEECINLYDIRAFNIRDDIFTRNRKRLFKILDGFKKHGVLWRCLTRVDLVDKEILLAMKEAGCVQVVYGIESGSQTILDNLQKDTTVEQNARAINMSVKAGIKTKASIIVGSPGETWDTINESIDFIEKNLPDEGIVCVFTPYPGSPVWDNPEHFGIKILTRDFSKYLIVGEGMRGNVVVETKDMSASDIAEARDLVLSRFRDFGIL